MYRHPCEGCEKCPQLSIYWLSKARLFTDLSPNLRKDFPVPPLWVAMKELGDVICHLGSVKE